MGTQLTKKMERIISEPFVSMSELCEEIAMYSAIEKELHKYLPHVRLAHTELGRVEQTLKFLYAEYERREDAQ